MNDRDKVLVYLSRLEISNKKMENILEKVKDFSFSSIFKDNNFVEILSKDEYHRFLTEFDATEFENSLLNMQNAGIKILTIFSSEYPKNLINLPDRPVVLYAKGDLSLLDKPCIAVVGTRSPSSYGKVITEKLVGEIASAGFVVVSGLCYGVDEIAHRKTLEVGGKTIAVVGSGFNNIYPSTNTALSKEIEKYGLLLSEYTPSFVAKRYTFPLRNRIVAGLSKGVLITEAALKSGTVHTKEYALEYGKDVFAVPGNINNPKSELPNHLIKTAQAECVTCGDDVIEFYGMKKVAAKNKAINLSFDEKTILDLLANGEKDFEYLVQKSQIPVGILNSCLTTLEIRGLIRRLPAGIFAAL